MNYLCIQQLSFPLLNIVGIYEQQQQGSGCGHDAHYHKGIGHAKRSFYVAGYFIASIGLLFAGGAFAFYIVFPLIFEFFLGFSTDTIQAMPAVKEYLTLVLKLLFAFGASFQIPIIVMILVRLDLVQISALADKRRYVVLWAFIFAAILTPPDIISQTLLALPMLLLYEVGILLAKMRAGEKQTSE